MDKELIILEQIQNNPHVNQRDLATIAKASLGMTNAILKRFAAKGLITIKKVNNRNIRYALTSEGMDEINRRSWGYFKRTIKNVVVYRDALSEMIRQATQEGLKGVTLVGESDLAFIIEHECYKQSVEYRCLSELAEGFDNGWFFFLAESQHAYDCETINTDRNNIFSLNQLSKNQD